MTSKSSTFFLFSANFYHYKGPRQTKLSVVIPCQKFFIEPVLITTFVLSGRFYNRSKKDVIRLSMTTVTDVDCLNVITIRLSIVFGDCMQSAEVKSNVFYVIFSSVRSPELETKLCINAQGRMTKMDTTPIYGKKL